ncbi:hypothetical protein EYE40_03170 [Glaciihabitans arcticus]|uniref:DUF7701 domain-containing protein n=1 Tax=Glaciihabitans arcticus TaxID=2668039 RepID=A0A4V2JEP7_9MICO|nr:hypothetical protein EYE40_03170 [Glaciihabitans arcticus]
MNYIDEIADRIRSSVPNRDLPESNTRPLFRMYAVLLLAKGAEVSREDVHNAWAAWMLGHDESHVSITPYGELSDAVAADDQPYVDAIRSVAEGRSE